MNVDFKVDKPIKKFEIIDKITSFLPHTHKWLDKLPEPYRSRAILLGYKLGIIKQVGYFKMIGYTDDTFTKRNYHDIITCNIIPDVGVTHIRDILAGTSSALPSYIEYGTGTSTPIAADTDVETPLDSLGGGGDKTRLSATVTSPGPYEIRLEVFISSTYGPTRPYSIGNVGIFTHVTNAPIIAHALVSPPYDMTGTNTAIGTYGLLLR